MTRIIFITGILLTMFLFGCAAPTTPVTPLPTATAAVAAKKTGTIRFADLSNIDVRDIPILLALDDLKVQGYDVQVIYLAENPQIVELLARGDAEIASVNNQTMWAGIAKGADVRTISESLGSASALLTRSDMKTCADLDGKRVAVPSPTTLTARLLNKYLQDNCPSAKPEFLTVQANDARNAGLLKGELDAALVQSEAFQKVDQAAPGKFHLLLRVPKAFPQVRIEGLHARRTWAEQNPEIVKDFIKAVLLSNRRVQQNPDLLVSEAVKRLKLDPATAKQIADEYLQTNLWDANGAMTKENLQTTLDFLRQNELLATDLQVDQVSDLQYLNAVLDEIGRK